MCSRSGPFDRALIWLVTALFVLVTGCESARAPPVPEMEVRERLGTVAIVPAQYVPRTNFDTFAKSKPSGAAKGAAAGAIQAPFEVLRGGDGFAIIVAPFVAILGAGIGAVTGAIEARPAEDVHQIEAGLHRAVANLRAQHALAVHVGNVVQQDNWIRLRAVSAIGPTTADKSPTYASLRPEGIDTVLEVAVTEFGFEDVCQKDSKSCKHKSGAWLNFFLRAQERLVRVSDGSVLYARQFLYDGSSHDAAEWLANDGRLLGDELENAYQDIAERMNDETFLIASIALPTPSMSARISDRRQCWLAPVYPALQESHSHTCYLSGQSFGLVDSLQPTLRWTGFPRDLDREQLDPGLLQKIGDVTYDLRIWEVDDGCERGRLVYERTGLSGSEHRVEEPLRPAHPYFWSVRARFMLNGKPMAMRWALHNPNSCYPPDMKDQMYYRFATPK